MRIPSGAAVHCRPIAALIDRRINIVAPDKITGHILMRTEQPLAGIVAGVARLTEYAAPDMGGAVPDQLCEVRDALANTKMQNSFRFNQD